MTPRETWRVPGDGTDGRIRFHWLPYLEVTVTIILGAITVFFPRVDPK